MSKHYFSTGITISIPVLFIFLSCRTFSVAQEIYTSIKLTSHFEFVKSSAGDLVKMDDNIGIVSYLDYVVYKIPHEFIYNKITRDKDFHIIHSIKTKEETKYSYLVYNRKKSYGYMFDSINVAKAYKVSVDSFLIKKAFKAFPFYQKGRDNLVKLIKNIDDILIEKYVCNQKKDASYFDTTYYFYDKKLSNVEYSFSRYLDSTRHSKLCKAKFIYNAIPATGQSPAIPKREFIFEIKRDDSINKKQIIDFINSFKNKENTLYNGN
ncbi:hypothetical protein ACFGVR_01030 [Mucilaginibacter sp. AW1-3]